MGNQVGLFWPDYSENAPCLDWGNSQLNWEKMRIDIWLFPSGPVDPTIEQQVAKVEHPLATEWDFYGCPGAWGIFSRRLRDAVAPFCKQCFEFWPIKLNGAHYFGIRRVGMIDCLDRERSGKYPRGKSPYYDPCVFHSEKLSNVSLFSIPEVPSIYITAGLARLLLPQQFRGVCIYNAAGNQRSGENMEWTQNGRTAACGDCVSKA